MRETDGDDQQDGAVDYWASGTDRIKKGHLEAARSAGAHDEYIAFVAEYPESKIADGLRRAVSMDALDDAQSFMSSAEWAFFNRGAKAVSNADVDLAEKMRELFNEDQLPEVLRE